MKFYDTDNFLNMLIHCSVEFNCSKRKGEQFDM